MAGRHHALDLPLLLTGVPAAAQDWLRQAGVPHAPLRLRGTGLSAVESETGRIVLFDSRSVASRQDAELARAVGLRTIDLYSLLRDRAGQGPSDEAPRLRFFNRLKQAVEACGGLWARVGDFPFPWQSALCGGSAEFAGDFLRILESFVPLPNASWNPSYGGDGDSTVIVPPEWFLTAGDDPARLTRRCYLAGRPLLAPSRDLGGTESWATARAPRLWQTTVNEFARWWRWRERLSVRVQKLGNSYRVLTDWPEGDFTPVLEIWQGTHVATFPLRRGEMTFPRHGLAFQEDTLRHPAGFTAQTATDIAAGRRQPQTA